jgi:hypothetical protein
VSKRTHCFFVVLLVAFVATAYAQDTRNPSILGQVIDEQGKAIVGSHISITDARGFARSRESDEQGKFDFPGLPPGDYVLRVSASNFTPYQASSVRLVPEHDKVLNVTLTIASKQETITVLSENPLIKNAEYVGGSFILRGETLMSMEGTGGLEALLRAMSLRSPGPFGPQALVNGFEDSQIPPAHTIREIRINDNPFSAEYAALGLGRIEILTKPGTEKFHLEAFGYIGDARLNSRNPYAPNRAPYQSRMYGGYASGPVWTGRSTFFIDFNKQEVDTNAVINATVVDSAFKITPLRLAVVTPEHVTSFAPRVDLQINDRHTIIARYGESRTRALNSSVGGFSLSSRAQDMASRKRTFQLTETAVLSPSTINEWRAQYVISRSARSGNNATPVIRVPGAFVGGGADVGSAYYRDDRLQVHNTTSRQSGKHLLKAGGQVKFTWQTDGSTDNFGGTYTFSARMAPQLNSRNEVMNGPAGKPVLIPITTIEAYRRTVLFKNSGLSPSAIRQLGGGASQFSLTSGEVETNLEQYEFGGFVQDDWRLFPRFSLSSGVRYERQNNIASDLDIAPRLAFAWGIGGQGQPETVLRGGVGMFYERVGEYLVLRARQMNGVHQRQYFVSDTSVLDLFPAVPSPTALTGYAVAQSKVQLAPDLRTPYSLQASIAVERQVVENLSLAATLSRVRTLHMLRSRNINAPQGFTRPFGTSADIFQYESSGTFNQQQLMLNMVYRPDRDVTLWSTYTLSDSKGDTDHPDTFPANSHDLRSEYGRSALNARHTLYSGGWIRTIGGIEMSPLVLWRSGVPFDITTGRDTNGDSLFTDRPAFATDLTRPSVIATRYGTFDVNPLPGQQIIPRNFGESSPFFITNLRASRRFAFTDRTSMTLAVQGQNIFNRTNPGSPVGNLGSSFFGIPTSSAGDWGFDSNQAGNRRLELLLFFSF